MDTWRKRMRRLRELNLIATKPGPSGEFYCVLLLKPNAAMEWCRANELVQDGVYARFLDRLIEVGGFSELESLRARWHEAAQSLKKRQAALLSP